MSDNRGYHSSSWYEPDDDHTCKSSWTFKGIDFSWHKCRHTYAKNLLRNEIDLETIRQMLGHANLSTTQIYSQLDSGEALDRIREKKPKLFKGSNRSNPKTIVYGLEGNDPVRFENVRGLLHTEGIVCNPCTR